MLPSLLIHMVKPVQNAKFIEIINAFLSIFPMLCFTSHESERRNVCQRLIVLSVFVDVLIMCVPI